MNVFCLTRNCLDCTSVTVVFVPISRVDDCCCGVFAVRKSGARTLRLSVVSLIVSKSYAIHSTESTNALPHHQEMSQQPSKFKPTRLQDIIQNLEICKRGLKWRKLQSNRTRNTHKLVLCQLRSCRVSRKHEVSTPSLDCHSGVDIGECVCGQKRKVGWQESEDQWRWVWSQIFCHSTHSGRFSKHADSSTVCQGSRIQGDCQCRSWPRSGNGPSRTLCHEEFQKGTISLSSTIRLCFSSEWSKQEWRRCSHHRTLRI